MSKLAKINWGLRHNFLKIIYTGAILPTLSYGAPVWIEYLTRNNNATKLETLQTVIHIKSQKHSYHVVRRFQRINRDNPNLNRTGKPS